MPKSISPYPEVGVLGAGSWGTTLALTLAETGRKVHLWCRREELAAAIRETRSNPDYLADIKLPDPILPTSNLDELTHLPLLFIVAPSKAMRHVASQLAQSGLSEDTILLSCTKGIENSSGLRMSQILEEIFPANTVAVLSGPNHAEEAARRLATASVIGCRDHATAAALQSVFTVPWFRAYTSTDIAGIELGGAIKNVFALAGGISDGLGLGDNAKAALVTRGLAELIRLGTALGGRPETFHGLSGVGDLIVTCYSEHSRNYRVGKGLGSGKSLANITASMNHMVAEGVPNTQSIHQLAHARKIKTPIIDEVYAVLYQEKPASDALNDLLSRLPRPESDLAHPPNTDSSLV